MHQTVYIDGQAHRIQSSDELGQGGEAVVYRHPGNQALKVYREFDDPAYLDDPDTQRAVRQRRKDHQTKLPRFPKGLPDHVVQPLAIAYDQSSGGQVVGYTMQFLPKLEELITLADKKFRTQGGIDANQVVNVFRNLYELVVAVHGHDMVIGDFNDLNVLYAPSGEAWLVDADSMQFGRFHCRTFTTRFVDPLVCEPDKLVLAKAKAHNTGSDWYAFATMLFQSLLFIDPYGGVHKPKSRSVKMLRDAARVLNRVTLFSPDVIVPKAAISYSALPDDLLQYFAELYEQDRRGVFPVHLLQSLRWTACTSCGIMHARRICPACAAPGVVKESVTVRGNVTATRLFRTDGQILFATVQGGELRYVYHESGQYKREGDVRVLEAGLSSELRVRVWGDQTVFGRGRDLVALDPEGNRSRFETQALGRLPVFAANGRHLYWIDGDRLVHDTPPVMRGAQSGAITIGSVLPNQTLVWAGDRFGFGFFRAGSLTRGLVFDAERPGVNDSVPLPPMTGNLVDATCTFASHTAWFMLTIKQGPEFVNHCYVISDTVELLAQAQAVQGDGTWLGESIRGHMATGQQLYVATDEGLVRIGIDSRSLVIERQYPDTEPFVDSEAQLFPSREGILAVSTREIVRLAIR